MQPADPSASAHARPMPDAAPVTTATWPASPNAALVTLVEVRLVRIGSSTIAELSGRCWERKPHPGGMFQRRAGSSLHQPFAAMVKSATSAGSPARPAAALQTSGSAAAGPAQPLRHRRQPGQHDQRQEPLHHTTPVIRHGEIVDRRQDDPGDPQTDAQPGQACSRRFEPGGGKQRRQREEQRHPVSMVVTDAPSVGAALWYLDWGSGAS